MTHRWAEWQPNETTIKSPRKENKNQNQNRYGNPIIISSSSINTTWYRSQKYQVWKILSRKPKVHPINHVKQHFEVDWFTSVIDSIVYTLHALWYSRLMILRSPTIHATCVLNKEPLKYLLMFKNLPRMPHKNELSFQFFPFSKLWKGSVLQAKLRITVFFLSGAQCEVMKNGGPIFSK